MDQNASTESWLYWELLLMLAAWLQKFAIGSAEIYEKSNTSVGNQYKMCSNTEDFSKSNFV